MKDATGELSTTVIAVAAIGMVLTIFVTILLPSIRASIRAKTYCSSAVQCSSCSGDGSGTRTCHYYNDDMTISEDTIECDCEGQSNG